MAKGIKYPEALNAAIKARWEAGDTPKQIRRMFRLTRGQLAGFKTRHHLHTPVERRRETSQGAPSVVMGRTRYLHRVTEDGPALKPGSYQSKIGGRVTKGGWRGMPIYALTLEERATCPRDCPLWVSCYGNGMHWAKRVRHGGSLEAMLWAELGKLQIAHRYGFVVRLHILGDFYSPGYVEFWAEALQTFPALRIFGYTARRDRIGRAVAALRDAHWGRFAIRTSGAKDGPRTLVIDEAGDCPPGAIICPAQTGKTASCATCGLCWAPAAKDRPVAFLRH